MSVAVAPRRPRVLFLNRSYRPDAEATGQLLTELAEDLAGPARFAGRVRAGGFDVTVICGRPNRNPTGEPAPCGRSVVGGVTVRRVRHTRLARASKRSLGLRAVDYLSFLAAALVSGLLCRRADVIVAETDPFPLAVVGLLLKLRHRAKFLIYAQDVHPELGVALGVLKDDPVVKSVRAAMHAAARRADAVVTLSADMKRTFLAQGVPPGRVRVLPNWTDTIAVRPVREHNPVRRELNLGEPGEAGAKFVVMHSGNMGRTQKLETVLAAAELLNDRPEILFLLVGGGAAEADLRADAARRELTNVRFLPYRPKAELAASLSAADVQLVCTDPRVVPFLMPSKLYGVLAAGVPAVCAAPANSELAGVVTGRMHGERCGWAVEPGDAPALAAAISAAADLPLERRRALGDAGRRTCEAYYSRAAVTPRFAATLKDVLGESVRTLPLPAGGGGGKDRVLPFPAPTPASPAPTPRPTADVRPRRAA